MGCSLERMETTHGLSPPSDACESSHKAAPLLRAGYFDLDKTLIPGSSLFLLARGLHARHFYRGDELVRFAWEQLVFRVGGLERAPALERSKEAALQFVRGRHRPELQALAEEIAVERIVPQVYPDMAARIEHHRSAGYLTFVATAAPAELAEIVAAGLGMTGALGTRAEVDETERYSGRLEGPVLRGEAKAEAVHAHAQDAGIDLDSSVAYSDSINDLPLLELVGEAEVVNPDRKLREVAEARGWPVHDLRPGRRRRTDLGGPGNRPGGTGPGGAARRQVSAPVGERLASLGLDDHVPDVADTAPNSRSTRFTVEDPDALVDALEQSGRFRRDTRLGALFHPGQISLRELAPANSLHISVGIDRQVSAHVDRYSPLSSNQLSSNQLGGRCRYSIPRVVAHNVSGMATEVIRLFAGRRR